MECTRFGPCCPQGSVPGVPPERPAADAAAVAAGLPDELPPGMDEDCLHLNVFTPAVDGRRPTLVWFHGGNLTGGSASDGCVFDPAARRGCNASFLSREHGIVVVMVTYRLNVFGFLNIRGGAANCGLLDAAHALRWVRDEIHAFGGDPGCVTIAGLSAGGHICSQLLAMPSASGLFHRAICMSGSAQWSLGTQEDHDRRIAGPFAKQLGFDSLEELTLDQARRIPAERLRQAYRKSGHFLESGTLTIDGNTVPRDPLDMMLEGCAKDVQVMSGVTRDEGVFSSRLKRKGGTAEQVVEDVRNHLGCACYLLAGDLDALRNADAEQRSAAACDLLRDYEDLVARYCESEPSVQEKLVNLRFDKCPAVGDRSYELAIKCLGDHDFTVSHIMAAWALSRHAPVYAYVFCGETQPGKRYAGHGADERFYFGTLPSNAKEGEVAAAEEAQLSSQMMEAVASFAKTGNPSTAALGEWPPVGFPRPAAATPLPGAPAGLEHMRFEFGRTGVVSHGWEETRIWFKHALRLGRHLSAPDQPPAVRAAVAAMVTDLYPDLLDWQATGA